MEDSNKLYVYEDNKKDEKSGIDKILDTENRQGDEAVEEKWDDDSSSVYSEDAFLVSSIVLLFAIRFFT